jgi:hypothetical protein
MASWRDAASQQAQDDLDGLLDPALGFAQQQLDKHSEFHPYAVVVDTDGQQRMVAADTGDDQPTSADLITMLVASLSSQRDRLRATAIVADVRVAEIDSDAVRVVLEHREGPHLAVLLPYKRRRFGRGFDFGQLQAATVLRQVW